MAVGFGVDGTGALDGGGGAAGPAATGVVCAGMVCVAASAASLQPPPSA